MTERRGTTCEQLEPLLRETWTNETAAFQVLVDTQTIWGRLVERAARRSRSTSALALTPEDVVSETVLLVVSRASARQGLTRPEDCAASDPTGWLVTTMRRRASDVLKPKQARGSGTGRRSESDWDPERGSRFDRIAHADSAADVRLDARRQLARLRAAVGEADLQPAHALAAMCRWWPDLVDLDAVERAAAASEGDRGLMRSVDETWRLLRDWLARHEDRTDTSDARRDLAWLLRSSDPTDSVQWRARSPGAYRKAADTVRVWAGRGKRKLLEVLP